MQDPLSYKDILSISGYLSVSNTSSKVFERKFCEIFDSKMWIYVDDSKQSLLSELVISSSLTIETQNFTDFKLSDSGKEIHIFRARTVPERKRWTHVIRALLAPQLTLSMDDFDIISVIGRGFYGKVLLCKRKSNGELYAIKTIHKDQLAKSQRPGSIVAERNILMMADNPFIIQLHFAFQTHKKFYLGMEYAPGGDLFYFLQQHGIVQLCDAKLYFAEIAVALHHLHKMDVIYRDLKPENVMFDAEGHVKLTDFGLAVDCNDGTLLGSTVCGTAYYLAPEIIRQREYSEASDWWALGVVLCEMVTGVVPFDAPEYTDIFEKIMHSEPVLPIEIDPVAADLVLKLLEKDASKRFGWNDIVTHPFLADLDLKTVAARRYAPVYVPEIAAPEATNNFDPSFTREAPIDSCCSGSEDEMYLSGFSFSEFQEQDDTMYVFDSHLIDSQM